MADNDLDSALKVGLKEIAGITKNLNLKFADRIYAAAPINEFTQAVNTHYNNLVSLYEHNPPLKENMQDLYQYISNDFKLLADKLAFNQNDKKQVLKDVVQKIDSAFKASSKHLKGLEEVSKIIPKAQAKNIIAEHAHEYHSEVVKDLFTEALKAKDKKDEYLNKLNALRTDTKTENKFNKIAKLNAKLQQDLNLNDRQINELNIGVGHYINNNRSAFKADLEKLSGKNQDNISREEITKVLNKKTAKSAQTLTQTAKEAVLEVGKRATTNFKAAVLPQQEQSNTIPLTSLEKPTQWKKAERSDKNPKTAASDYRNSQEVDPKSSHINNLHNVSNLDKTQVKQDNKTILSRVLKTIPTTKLERVYDATVRGIEADVIQKTNAKLTEIKSTVSHKMPPEAKEFATKLGQDVSATAHAAAERVKGAKDRIKTFIKNKWQGR